VESKEATRAKNFPEFYKVIEAVSNLNPLQKKRIAFFLENQNNNYWMESERICKSLKNSFFKNDQNFYDSVKAYNRMTTDFLKEQIRFKKTGKYLLDNAANAKNDVYDNPEVMRYYMIGLCLSYLLWPNHFRMYKFFQKFLNNHLICKNYLDVAPGHGLFAAEVLKKFPGAKAKIVDISGTSLQVSKELLSSFNINENRYEAILGDFLDIKFENNSFDFLTMGEVLEHVENPVDFLKKASNLITEEGYIFMTTCSNAPAIDHIYHFHNSQEIRDLIEKAGLKIVEEEVIPAENVPEELCEKELVTVNYCCILSKK
jgi:2-polyprenyl-3-methyl-5-hydroxy-6-metoxy-1,4-benzoquinol methylase